MSLQNVHRRGNGKEYRKRPVFYKYPYALLIVWLCDVPISRPAESYRMWCTCVWSPHRKSEAESEYASLAASKPNFNICCVWRRIIWWRYYRTLPIPVPARPKAWVCCRSPAEIVGSNPTGGMDVCCECCVLSGRDLCDGLITRPEESYRLWCIVVCDPGTSWMRRPSPTGGYPAKNKL
jgi:hypothetical protein